MVPLALEANGRDRAIDAVGLRKSASAASLLVRRSVEVGVVNIAVVDPWPFLLRLQIRWRAGCATELGARFSWSMDDCVVAMAAGPAS